MKTEKIKDIRKEALHSLNHDSDGRLLFSNLKKYSLYYVLPALISILLLLAQQFLSGDSIAYFITGISIFAGLFFNLLLVVSDKMEKRKFLVNDPYEPTRNYAIRYRTLCENLISSISYTILLSIVLIVLMFISQTTLPVFNFLEEHALKIEKVNLILKYVFNFLCYVIGIQFIFFLVHILTGIYDILIHEMNMKSHQHPNEQ